MALCLSGIECGKRWVLDYGSCDHVRLGWVRLMSVVFADGLKGHGWNGMSLTNRKVEGLIGGQNGDRSITL